MNMHNDELLYYQKASLWKHQRHDIQMGPQKEEFRPKTLCELQSSQEPRDYNFKNRL